MTPIFPQSRFQQDTICLWHSPNPFSQAHPLDPAKRKTPLVRRLRRHRRICGAAQGAGHDSRMRSSRSSPNPGLRGRGGAGFSARAEMVVHPQGKEGPALPGRQRRRIRARHLQGSLSDRLRSAFSCWKASPSPPWPRKCDVAYIFIRGEYHRQAKVLERAIKEAYDHGIFGQQGILGSEYKLECYRPSRRRGVHLRRRNRPAGSAGRQARLAAQ